MSVFKTKASPKVPTLMFIEGKWQNKAKITIWWRNFKFDIPLDYRSDLGSVPWVFQWIVKSTGLGNLAFLAHDYIYDDDQPLPKQDGLRSEMTRYQADLMMRDLLEYSGMSKWRRTVAWRGVRRGGWLSFKKED